MTEPSAWPSSATPPRNGCKSELGPSCTCGERLWPGDWHHEDCPRYPVIPAKNEATR